MTGESSQANLLYQSARDYPQGSGESESACYLLLQIFSCCSS